MLKRQRLVVVVRVVWVLREFIVKVVMDVRMLYVHMDKDVLLGQIILHHALYKKFLNKIFKFLTNNNFYLIFLVEFIC